MKRFSKIFCVALVAIVLSSLLTLRQSQPVMAENLAANGVDKDLAQQLKNILDTKYPAPETKTLEACQLGNNVVPTSNKVSGPNVCTSYCVYTFLKDNDISLYDDLVSTKPGSAVNDTLNKKIIEPSPYGYYNYDTHKYTTSDDTADAARGYSYSTGVCSKKSGLANIYNDIIWPGLTNIANTNNGTKINGYLKSLIDNLGFGSPTICDTSKTAFSVFKYQLTTPPFSVYTQQGGKEESTCKNSTFGQDSTADKICLNTLAADLTNDKNSDTLNPGHSNDRANDIISLANALTMFADCPTATSLSAISTTQQKTITGVTENPDNSDCSNNNPSFWNEVTHPIKSLFEIINIGIIKLTGLVIKMGVNTMGWLMQPHNLLGGEPGVGISNNPAVIQAFGASVSVVNIVFSIVLIIMAIGTILNLKNYRINDLITKFIVVALLINFTLVIAGSVLDLANYISLYFFNATLKSIQSGDVATKWIEILTNKVCLSSAASDMGRLFFSIFINLLAFIAIAAAMFSVCGSLLKRIFMLMFLLIISPFAVICYLLPAKGMGQWWDKWKKAFLQQAFYGIYISVGFYLGTIMLSALSISNQSSNEELSFVSGLIKPILAAGYLIFIVLLSDEIAGGSAKSTIEGATKLALGAAAGGATAIAMKAKNAITTSEGYGKTVSSLSTKKGLGWLGNAGLKVREDSLDYRSKQGEALDTDVNRRDVDTNKARLKELDGSKDPKAAREMAAIAKQLYAKKQMDEDSAKLLEKNADTIGSKENARNGWIPYTLKKTLKDLGPNLFTRADLESDTGMTEGRIMDELTAHGGDIEATAIALMPQGSLAQQKKIGDAIKKYFDARTKAGIQFAQNAANTSDKFVLQTILDDNAVAQEKIMEGLAQTPATMKHVLEQIESSGLGNDEKRHVYDLFQAYMDQHGSRFNEKQLDWIDTNIGQINTDEARGRISCPEVAQAEATAEDARRTNDKTNKMYSEAIAEDARRTNERQKQIEEAFKDNATLITLDKEIKQAKLDMYTASTAEKAKKAEQHINELLKKRQDIISGSNHS